MSFLGTQEAYVQGYQDAVQALYPCVMVYPVAYAVQPNVVYDECSPRLKVSITPEVLQNKPDVERLEVISPVENEMTCADELVTIQISSVMSKKQMYKFLKRVEACLSELHVEC
jgi:hypothetical protein